MEHIKAIELQEREAKVRKNHAYISTWRVAEPMKSP